jgi:hypothetical protein
MPGHLWLSDLERRRSNRRKNKKKNVEENKKKKNIKTRSSRR